MALMSCCEKYAIRPFCPLLRILRHYPRTVRVQNGGHNANTLSMHINLPPDQEHGFDGSDLAWTKPLVDEARAAVARGEVSTLDDAIADIDEVLLSHRP
jgi:hypothetical protein